jgi:hypothetical protein
MGCFQIGSCEIRGYNGQHKKVRRERMARQPRAVAGDGYGAIGQQTHNLSHMEKNNFNVNFDKCKFNLKIIL